MFKLRLHQANGHTAIRLMEEEPPLNTPVYENLDGIYFTAGADSLAASEHPVHHQVILVDLLVRLIIRSPRVLY